MEITVTKNTTIGELCQTPDFKPFSDYFFTKMTDDVRENSLDHYGFEKCGFADALERIHQLAMSAKDGNEYIYSIYGKKEWEEEPDKRDVKLIHMPGEGQGPYVLVCPGGAYARQWGIIEGLAVGAQLNKLGYTAFILYYRTMQKPPFTEALFPRPLEDLERAVRWIGEHSEKLKVKKEGYAVAGFSAGAHLAAEWGTVNFGWKARGVEGPAALILGYPSISTDVFCDALEEAEDAEHDPANYYLTRLGGPHYTREGLRQYSVELHMDENYPPVYLVACQDDPVVPIKCSRLMVETMERLGIPFEANIPQHGGHSFGVGAGTEAEGWIEKAVQFWQSRL